MKVNLINILIKNLKIIIITIIIIALVVIVLCQYQIGISFFRYKLHVIGFYKYFPTGDPCWDSSGFYTENFERILLSFKDTFLVFFACVAEAFPCFKRECEVLTQILLKVFEVELEIELSRKDPFHVYTLYDVYQFIQRVCDIAMAESASFARGPMSLRVQECLVRELIARFSIYYRLAPVVQTGVLSIEEFVMIHRGCLNVHHWPFISAELLPYLGQVSHLQFGDTPFVVPIEVPSWLESLK